MDVGSYCTLGNNQKIKNQKLEVKNNVPHFLLFNFYFILVKMIKQKHILSLLVLFTWLATTNATCTKEIVYAKDYFTAPEKIYASTDKITVMAAMKKTLEQLGYEIASNDEENGKMTTGWKAVEVDSHYYDLFGRPDYGSTDGAYYQLLVDLNEEGSRLKVLVATKVKTIVGKLHSSGKVEKRVLKQLEDYLRSPQIEMSNVGVRKK